ncbi:Sialic acid-binding Ig-like lectin 5 [Camelus dromedarius]|uniref:Sialic acid-binding Ig-like lectin 5 n=1 Tax=Camelus dromedarius TaxID=9838 RepID=A0A5N4DRG2_CAMDR|nr:Sialic acid-binding Ig-like lectin 5 [Camelus dromedarius]
MGPLLLLLLCDALLVPAAAPGTRIQVQESVTVQECLGANVSCSFSFPGRKWSTPYIYWFRQGDNVHTSAPVATNDPQRPVKAETEGRFHLLGNRRDDCSLSIRDARMSDSGTYFFRVDAGYPERYTYRNTLNLQGHTLGPHPLGPRHLPLSSSALTEKPDIQFLEPLESGRPTSLTCSLPVVCAGARFLRFSWAGDALDAVDPEMLHSSVLTLTPRPQDHGTNLTCQVTLQGGQGTTLERTVQLNVSYAPSNLSISVSLRNVTGRKEPVLPSTGSCSCDHLRAERAGDSELEWDQIWEKQSNPPAQLSWFRGSPALNATPISSTAILELPGVGTAEEGEFTCRAQNPLDSQHLSLSLSVVYPPQLLGPSCSWEDGGLHCSCSSRAQPAPSLRWWLGEGLLEGTLSNASYMVNSSSAGPWANSSLRLTEGLSSGFSLSCEALNVHGVKNATVLLLPGKSTFLTGVALGALGGAGAMALLSLCLCLVYFCMKEPTHLRLRHPGCSMLVSSLRVKAGRKQAARSPESPDEDPIMGTVGWGSRQKSWPDSPPDQAPSPVENAPPSGEQQELHYASLSFHDLKSREPQDREATSNTEYSEIKINK